MRKAIVPTRAVKRARRLIDLLMKEMHASLLDPERLTPEQWDKLFGAKQSMIANLHKLVATLMALADTEDDPDKADEQVFKPINAQEMQLLSAWLAQEND